MMPHPRAILAIRPLLRALELYFSDEGDEVALEHLKELAGDRKRE
jgi:hypothetical protein